MITKSMPQQRPLIYLTVIITLCCKAAGQSSSALTGEAALRLSYWLWESCWAVRKRRREGEKVCFTLHFGQIIEMDCSDHCSESTCWANLQSHTHEQQLSCLAQTVCYSHVVLFCAEKNKTLLFIVTKKDTLHSCLFLFMCTIQRFSCGEEHFTLAFVPQQNNGVMSTGFASGLKHKQNCNCPLTCCLFCLYSSSFLLPPTASPPLTVFLSFLSLGGGEDYRQNPAESHQSTEGESLFYGQVVTLNFPRHTSC